VRRERPGIPEEFAVGGGSRLATRARRERRRGMNEWREMTLREAGVSLIDCDHRTPPPSEIGYPYVAIPQLKQGRIDWSNARSGRAERIYCLSQMR
jgi:hypothetical protein